VRNGSTAYFLDVPVEKPVGHARKGVHSTDCRSPTRTTLESESSSDCRKASAPISEACVTDIFFERSQNFDILRLGQTFISLAHSQPQAVRCRIDEIDADIPRRLAG
jgi:hypothetical protein